MIVTTLRSLTVADGKIDLPMDVYFFESVIRDGRSRMKRQYFDISLNGSVVATTFAWNAAIRVIERLVRERARLVAVEYKLVESHTEGPDKWHFTRGHRTWRSAHETLRYDIKLRGSIPTC